MTPEALSKYYLKTNNTNLPVSGDTISAAASAEIAAQILASPILIVEDNQVSRLFLEETLRARGFLRLLSVESGEEALKRIDAFQPEIILLDLMMPDGMNGFDCCELIRKNKDYSDLPILIHTAITEPELRVRAFQKGATDFVSKPVNPDELCARVTVHLEKRRSLRVLQLYKNRIGVEMENARQLQLSILPTVEDIADIERKCKLAISSHFRPCSEIGGDFWGLKSLFPHQAAMWLVDFSGHGMASALNAFRLQAYLKEQSQLMTRPGEYLSHLNDKLLHLLMRGQFATMFYGIADTQSNQLFYACASMPHPIILRKETGKAEIIDGSGKPLGIGMHLYPTQTVRFAAGDMLLLYSDALIETPSARGEYITEEEICALLEKYPAASGSTMKEILLDHFREHAGEILHDDFTLILCTRAA